MNRKVYTKYPDITIDKDVPLPPDGRRHSKYPWSEMEVGDSFVAEREAKRGGLLSSSKHWPKAHDASIRWATRACADGHIRIWRTK